MAPLPDELLLDIFDRLPLHTVPMHGAYASLYKNLSLVSRKIYRLIRPLTWRSIVLLGIKTLRPQALRLCALLKDDPLLASMVRSVTMRAWDLGPEALYQARAGQMMPDVYRMQERGDDRSNDRSLVYDAIKFMTNLTTLHIESCAFLSPFDRIVSELPRLSQLTLRQTSFNFFEDSELPYSSKLTELTIFGGSEDQSYLRFCLDMAGSSELRHLSIAQSQGSAVSPFLPYFSRLNLVALRSLEIRNLMPDHVEHIHRVLTVVTLLQRLALFQEHSNAFFPPLSINVESYPWRILADVQLPHLIEFSGAAALLPLFLRGSLRLQRLYLVETPHTQGVARLPGAVRELSHSACHVQTVALRFGAVTGQSLDATLSQLPLVAELYLWCDRSPFGMEENRAVDLVTPHLARFIGLRVLGFQASERSAYIGHLPNQCETVRQWSQECPSLVLVQLAKYTKWAYRDGHWTPEFSEDAGIHLTQYLGRRRPPLTIDQDEVVDWQHCVRSFILQEGLQNEVGNGFDFLVE